MMDWFSYILGLMTLPALVVVLLLSRALLAAFTGRRHRGAGVLTRRSSHTSPLQFNPRLVGKLRSPVTGEERSAEAS